MRKLKLFIPLLSVLLVLLTACASKTEAPAVMLAETAPSEIRAKSNAKSSAVQKFYTNDKLSFSLAVPDSWEDKNYTPVVTTETMSDGGTKYTKVDFLFQNDKNCSLLTISLVSKDWWEKTKGETLDPKPTYLGTKEDVVYCFTLPKSSPYEVGEKSDLFNSMVLPDSDVLNRFKILDANASSSGISTVEGTLEEIMTQTITIKTDDGRSITFLRDGTDADTSGKGLQLGRRLRIYYEGAIDGSNTRSVTITKIERLS